MSRASLPQLTTVQSLNLLSTLSGMHERDVERDPTYASELAAMRCIDARDTLLAARNAKRNGL